MKIGIPRETKNRESCVVCTPGGARMLTRQGHEVLLNRLAFVDFLVGAVLIPGSTSPKLINREMLAGMKPGSVFVDIAIDHVGGSETSRPTTYDDPIYVEQGVIHYCVRNMPGAYARTATQALTNSTMPYAIKLANLASKEP